jgi:hypothetical protein
MTARTWNLKLMATDEHPETTLEGVSQEAASTLLRELMYGSLDHAHAQAAAARARADRHEGPLAA